MRKTLLLASVAALALCAGGVSAGTTKHPAAHAQMNHAKAQFKTANRALDVLYDQNSDSQGYADVSQNFESSLDAYDAQGADDFTVPDGSTWKVSEVDVTGLYFNGPGPAVSENVFFYKASGGKKGGPKKLVAEFDNVVGDDDGVGDFVIDLGKKGAKLKAGHYFVSVQVNMDYDGGAIGEWGWATRNTQVGTAAQWENPGDGFTTGCTAWSDEQDCLGDLGGPDHMFTLRGKSK